MAVLAHGVDLDAAEIGHGGAAEHAVKLAFERAAAHTRSGGETFDTDFFAVVCADV